MTRMMLTAAFAALTLAVTATTATAGGAFGVFYGGRYCSTCNVCFRPYNAFTPCGGGAGGCGHGGCGAGGCANPNYYYGNEFAGLNPYFVGGHNKCGYGCGGCGFGGCHSRKNYVFEGVGDSIASGPGVQHLMSGGSIFGLKKAKRGSVACDGCGVPGGVYGEFPAETYPAESYPVESHPAPAAVPALAPVAPAYMQPVSYYPQYAPAYPYGYGYGYPMGYGYPNMTPAYGYYGR